MERRCTFPVWCDTNLSCVEKQPSSIPDTKTNLKVALAWFCKNPHSLLWIPTPSCTVL